MPGLTSVEFEITELKERLKRHACDGHSLLSGQFADSFDLPVARLLFIVASLGSVNREELISVGVGMELLRLGIEKHYRQDCCKTISSKDRNLLLVAADYYYAKAIGIAVSLRRGDVIGHMVRAIADIAEAEALKGTPAGDHETDSRVDEKSAGLFLAAVRLGLLLGGNTSEATSDILRDHAVLYSATSRNNALSKSGEDNHSSVEPGIDLNERLNALRSRVIEGLKLLPPAQSRALGKLVSCG